MKYKSEIIYGIAMASLLFLLKWLEYKYVMISHSYEFYATFIAVIFMGLGIWLARKLMQPKTLVIEKEVVKQVLQFEADEQESQKLGLSTRELEVLQLIADGLSNQEIAEKLFLSTNTVKTHSSRIFEKLDVRRRTQAVEKAKRLRIIA